MRIPIRIAFVTLVAASCNHEINEITRPPYDPCAGDTTQDTIFRLTPESLHLVVGAADRAWLEWAVATCADYVPLSVSEVTWTVRDDAVVSEEPEGSDPRGAQVVPKAPGHTYVVVEVGGRSDSLRVSVPDTSTVGPSTWVAAGAHTSCAVSDAGEASCWGAGDSHLLGAFGTDPAVGTCWGIPCSPRPVERTSGAASVYVGESHACVLDGPGHARCWGDNAWYQLGVEIMQWSADPVDAGGGISFGSLTLGRSHTCGLASTGEAYCWGDHSLGRLGGGQRTGPVASPVLVSDVLRFSSIDAGDLGTCGTSDEGRLYCWGRFSEWAAAPEGSETCTVGAVKGTSTVACSFVPLVMDIDAGLGGDSLFVQVSGSCALTTEGSVFCRDFGSGSYSPKVGFGPFATLTAGRSHMCGLTSEGAAHCWGENLSGALGDGSRQSREEPVPVDGGHVFTRLVAGDLHTCGLASDGLVWCWGENDIGQAGTSILIHPTSPTRVRGQG